MLFLESETEIGQEVEVTLYRDGEKMTRNVTVEERPAEDIKEGRGG